MPLPNRHTIRRRFDGYAYVEITAPGDTQRSWANIEADIEIQDGEAVALEVRIFGTIASSSSAIEDERVPLDRAALAKINLAQALDNAVIFEAASTSETFRSGLLAARGRHETAEVWGRGWTEAAESTRSVRRRRHITPELLAQVLELYDQGGIDLVASKLNYGVSYAWKLLRRAREEMGQ